MKVLLYIEPSGLTVHRLRAPAIATRFAADANGVREFSGWLRANNGAVMVVCIDNPQIECHRESAPALRGRERQQYLAGLCSRLAPNARLLSVHQRTNRTGEDGVIVLTTLADEAAVLPWFEQLLHRRALVEGVFFLPIGLAAIAQRQSRRSILMLVDACLYGGLRVSLCGDGKLLLTRYLPLADDLSKEIQRTLQYAHRNALVATPEDAVTVLLRDGENTEIYATPRQGIADSGHAAVARFIAAKHRAEELVPQLIATGGNVPGLRDRQFTARYQVARAAQRIWLLGSLCVLLCAGALTVGYSQSRAYQTLFDKLDSQRQLVSAQLEKRAGASLSIDEKISAVQFVDRVRAEGARLPLQTLSWLASILQRHGAVQLRALQWHRDITGRDTQRLIVVGQIDENLVELVGAITVYSELVASLRRGDLAQLQVTKAPFGLGTALTDSSRVNADLNDRDFRFELSFDGAG